MNLLKFILMSLLALAAASGCTPVYVYKATTTMDGKCTDIESCTPVIRYMEQPYKYS